MCFQDIGVKKFRLLRFVHSQWIHYKIENNNFKVKKSNIKNAGFGLFAKTNIKKNEKILNYQGEPLEQWYYEALEHKESIFTGVKINIPKIGNCVYRGIPNTLGVFINSVLKENDANVEFIIDYNKIKKETINGDGLISIYTKKEIKKGEELFLFYGKDFWKNHETHKEEYCLLCISFDSHLKNLMLLCDKCNNGFHERCLEKHLGKKQKIPKGKWFCFNCTN